MLRRIGRQSSGTSTDGGSFIDSRDTKLLFISSRLFVLFRWPTKRVLTLLLRQSDTTGDIVTCSAAVLRVWTVNGVLLATQPTSNFVDPITAVTWSLVRRFL